MRKPAHPASITGRDNRHNLTGPAAPPLTMSYAATAAACGVSPRTFRNWMRAGRGPVPIRLGGRHTVFLAEDVVAFLRAHRGACGREG